MIELFLRSLALKDEERSGWVLRGVRTPESVADHSWATASLCLFYAGEANVDRSHAVEMAIIHDLAEAVTGDIATRVAAMSDPTETKEKRRRENAAMKKLLGGIDGPVVSGIRDLWNEYESASTPVARFVRDMNLIDMCAQALVYEEQGRYEPDVRNEHFPEFRGMDEFFATTRPRLTTDLGRQLFAELTNRYGLILSVRNRGGIQLKPHPEGMT